MPITCRTRKNVAPGKNNKICFGADGKVLNKNHKKEKSKSAPKPVKKAPVKKTPAPAPVKKAPAPAPVKKAPAPAPVKKAPVKQLSGLESVKNPKDITSSSKIKKLIKDFLGGKNVATTIKMPDAEGKTMTNKAMVSINGFRIKEVEQSIKKYNELPKNIKDNLGLSIYGYEKEMHNKFKSLKVQYSKFGAFIRFYNP
tara:strand:- start:48 stop:641 length:594 start_codon:yes stop_codon:yes gene_type:complete